MNKKLEHTLTTEVMSDHIDKHVEVLHRVLKEKNLKYKNSVVKTIDKYGDATIPIRLSDKLARLEAFLLEGKDALNDENLLDTLLDIAGYAILGRIYYTEHII